MRWNRNGERRKMSRTPSSIIQKALKGKQVAWGTHCFSSDMEVYESCGLSGYDYVWIDSEHAATTRINIKNGIIAAKAGGCSAFVRVGALKEELVRPLVELQPDGIVVPHVETVEQAQLAVQLCTSAIAGRHGFLLPEESVTKPLVMLQCESLLGVENLDAIMAVPGVDVIIIGPMDLAGSMGKLHDNKHPEVIKQFECIAEKCRKAGKPFGLSIGYDLELVRWFVSQGATFISMGQHVTYFRIMSTRILQELRATCPANTKH